MQVACVYVDTPYIPVQVDSSSITLTSPLLSGVAGPAMMPGPGKERNCACRRCGILATPT